MRSLTSLESKHYAKSFLRKHWGEALIILAVSVSVSLIFSQVEQVVRMISDIPLLHFETGKMNVTWPSLAITAIQMAVVFLVTAPLQLGIAKWFWQLTQGQSNGVLTIFEYYSSSWLIIKALGFTFSMTLRVAGYAILLFTPGIAVLLLKREDITAQLGFSLGEEWALGIRTISGVLLLAAVFVFLILISRYFCAPYFLIREELSAGQAISKSILASKGKKGKVLWFYLSFFGWMLTIVLALPILYHQRRFWRI